MDTQAYKNCGYSLFTTPLIDREYPKIIASYHKKKGLELGSPTFCYVRSIQQYNPDCIITVVDPSPLETGIIAMTAEDFVRECTQHYDFIIIKYCIHLFSNLDVFFANVKRILAPSGIVFIFTSLPDCQFPWSPDIQKKFQDSCIDIVPFLHDFVIQKKETYCFHNTISTTSFNQILDTKGISILDDHEEKVINSHTELPYKLSIQIYELTHT